MSLHIPKIKSIHEAHMVLNMESPLHPLVSIVDFSNLKVKDMALHKAVISFYIIIWKDRITHNIRYGRELYDFQNGTLYFFAPEQVISLEDEVDDKDPNGWGIFFHPDLIKGFHLDSQIHKYSFFDYAINEALHISEKERIILQDFVGKIQSEIQQNLDNHSQQIVVSNIELILQYCLRFYDRQFITRKNVSKGIVAETEKLLLSYFNSNMPNDEGLPTVEYCADQMNLTPKYLSDLLKKETGKTTMEHIHYHLINKAKSLLLNSQSTVNEIAYGLGFDYPQYFNKLFKSKTGYSPKQYRTLN
jgi:AraC-like DNA-binding protein